MADANRLAAALRYQQNMEGPVTMNPNIAEQGRKGRANMAPPTSLMDPRSRDYERRSKETENFLIGADILTGALPFAPLAKGAAMAAGRYAGPELARGLENYMVKSGAVLPMDVWHGSPHRFPPTAKNPLGEFDPMKIGTGEGAQAYGHGLYFAENPGVTTGYKIGQGDSIKSVQAQLDAVNNALNTEYRKSGSFDATKNARRLSLQQNNLRKQLEESKQGYLYKVDLPDEHIAKMLDWNKPLKDQNPAIQKVLQDLVKTDALGRPTGISVDSNINGQWAYERLAGIRGAKYASEAMREAGIPGIRYLDQGSRAGGAGTSNFVVFDPAHMNIIGRE